MDEIEKVIMVSKNIGKHSRLALRLGDILAKLNNGERLEVRELAEEFQVTPRTIIRDLRDRLTFLDWDEMGPKYYSLNKSTLGQLYQEDIKRFSHFASIKNLFPKIDREFYQKQLHESIVIRGMKYEDISNKIHDFTQLKKAIEDRRSLFFSYLKNDGLTFKQYTVQPYLLINRNGIWYLIAIDAGKIKTFCFTQISNIRLVDKHFERDEILLEEIQQSESIYYGSQIERVLLEVDSSVALYFQRRELVPNQTLHEILVNGNLQIFSEMVSEQEILALVRYWIPHLKIIEPKGLQKKLEKSLKVYLG